MPTPDPTTLITDEMRDVAARALYDQQNGAGAFDEERRCRHSMGLKWPTATFQSVYRDVDAVIAAIVPDIVKAEREACIEVALGCMRNGRTLPEEIEAAIRARGVL